MVRVESATLLQGGRLIQRDLDFAVRAGEVFVIVGPSGCGKSTLLRAMVGLLPPSVGRVRYGSVDPYDCDDAALARLRRRFGVAFQTGALWSAMTIGENLMLPMQMFGGLDARASELRARFKLALVGLDGAFDLEPAALSGGMRKRAAIARALALDPELLFLDEPASGLDPVNVARLDTLLLQLREHLGTTVVMVTHDMDSVMAVADRVLYLDERQHTMTALDAPRVLLERGDPVVSEFLRKGRPK